MISPTTPTSVCSLSLSLSNPALKFSSFFIKRSEIYHIGDYYQIVRVQNRNRQANPTRARVARISKFVLLLLKALILVILLKFFIINLSKKFLVGKQFFFFFFLMKPFRENNLFLFFLGWGFEDNSAVKQMGKGIEENMKELGLKTLSIFYRITEVTTFYVNSGCLVCNQLSHVLYQLYFISNDEKVAEFILQLQSGQIEGQLGMRMNELTSQPLARPI